jgi:gliding motility-associated-like protein
MYRRLTNPLASVSIHLGWLPILLMAQVSFAQPTFTDQGDVLSYLNDGPQTIVNWATITSGDPPFSFSTSVSSTTGTITFDVAPEVASDGTLTYTVTPGTSGTAVVLTTLNDAITSSVPSTFNINVLTNTAPQFGIPAPDIVIDEKAGAQQIINFATGIAAGVNPEENGQALTFILEPVMPVDPFVTFVSEPGIDKFGAITFEATEFATGVVNYLVYLEDDGSAVLPNVNKSAGVPISITINPINDPPSFTVGESINIDEHTGLVTISDWATDISAGGPDESGQTLSFVVTQTSITPFLQFTTPVTVDTAGTLSFEITPHYHGIAIYEIYLTDQLLNSPVQAFTVNVDYINDPPEFTVGPDLLEDEGDVLYTYPNWATNISPGLSPDEQDQKLLFTVNLVQTNGTIAFLQAPVVDETGQLTMRPTEHTHGEAIFDIILSDDGDFEPPHKNFGDPQTFKVTINKINFPPDDIRLSNNEILEKEAPGTVIGFLTAADLDPEDVHSFALVAGEGSDDNASFQIQQEQLISAESFDWVTKRVYKIRIKTSDGEFSLEKTFEIQVLKFIDGIKFANAITPNADGENDVWEIEDIESFPDATVFIYDKSGQSVYNSRGGYIPWDGTLNGRTLPIGTYYYVIDLHDGSSIYQGTITIIL